MSDLGLIRVYENRLIVRQDAFTGSGLESFSVLTGSRMLITLQVAEIDPDTTVTLYVDNGYSRDEALDTIENLSVNGVGTVKRIISDFNNVFDFRYTVTGGMAKVRIAIAIYDNAGTTRIDNAQLDVNLSHVTDAMGHFDSTRIGDGTNLLEINDDGSINVSMDNAADETTQIPYSEISAVVQDIETDLLTYTVPPTMVAFLYRAETSGENVAQYRLYKNGVAFASQRTHFGSDLNAHFDFTTPNKRPNEFAAGDVITITVVHSRPDPGNFEGRLVLLEKVTT